MADRSTWSELDGPYDPIKIPRYGSDYRSTWEPAVHRTRHRRIRARQGTERLGSTQRRRADSSQASRSRATELAEPICSARQTWENRAGTFRARCPTQQMFDAQTRARGE